MNVIEMEMIFFIVCATDTFQKYPAKESIFFKDKNNTLPLSDMFHYVSEGL